MAAGDRRSDHQAVTLVTRRIIMDVYAHTAMLGWRVTGATLWGQAWYRLRPEDAGAQKETDNTIRIGRWNCAARRPTSELL